MASAAVISIHWGHAFVSAQFFIGQAGTLNAYEHTVSIKQLRPDLTHVIAAQDLDELARIAHER